MGKLIIPIAMTSVDWPTYINTLKQHLNIDVESDLKRIGFNTDKLSSYLSSLSFDGKFRQNITESIHNPTHDHVSVSFLTTIQNRAAIIDFTDLPLKIIKKYISVDDHYLVIITGSINDWHHAVIQTLTSDEYNRETCQIFSSCMYGLELFGFKSIWANWEKCDVNKESFKLRRIK